MAGVERVLVCNGTTSQRIREEISSGIPPEAAVRRILSDATIEDCELVEEEKITKKEIQPLVRVSKNVFIL
jgi:hypothetical protein